MRIAAVLITIFFAAFLGSALGAALIVHSGWFGREASAPEAPRRDASAEERQEDEARREAARRAEEERRRMEEDRKRREEQARRRGDEEAKRRADEEAKRRADEEARRREQEDARRDKQGQDGSPAGVTCEHALPDLKGAFTSEMDCFYVTRLFKLVLETARDGSDASTWNNQRSGTRGTIRILATVPGADGVFCRRFEQTVTVSGKTASATGVACFRNSAWQIQA